MDVQQRRNVTENQNFFHFFIVSKHRYREPDNELRAGTTFRPELQAQSMIKYDAFYDGKPQPIAFRCR